MVEVLCPPKQDSTTDGCMKWVRIPPLCGCLNTWTPPPGNATGGCSTPKEASGRADVEGIAVMVWRPPLYVDATRVWSGSGPWWWSWWWLVWGKISSHACSSGQNDTQVRLKTCHGYYVQESCLVCLNYFICYSPCQRGTRLCTCTYLTNQTTLINYFLPPYRCNNYTECLKNGKHQHTETVHLVTQHRTTVFCNSMEWVG